MATSQSTVTNNSQWQDYAPPQAAPNRGEWQDYAPHAPSQVASTPDKLNPPKENLIPSDARISAPPIGGQYGGGNWNPENWGDEARQKLMKYEPFRNAMELLLGGQNVGQPLGTSSGVLNNPVTQSILPGGSEERGAEEGVDAAEATEPVAAKAARNVGHGIHDAFSGKTEDIYPVIKDSERTDPRLFEQITPGGHTVTTEEPGYITRGIEMQPRQVISQEYVPSVTTPAHAEHTPIKFLESSPRSPSIPRKLILSPEEAQSAEHLNNVAEQPITSYRAGKPTTAPLLQNVNGKNIITNAYEREVPGQIIRTPIREGVGVNSIPSRLGKFLHTPIIPNAPYTSPTAIAIEAILGGGLGYAGMRAARSILGGSK